jgi:hypothetical protein
MHASKFYLVEALLGQLLLLMLLLSLLLSPLLVLTHRAPTKCDLPELQYPVTTASNTKIIKNNKIKAGG